MNSEELERSLRTEFENYLRAVVAEMRQETAELQNRLDAEIERHREQLNEVVRNFSSGPAPEHEVDEAFLATVAEHLRLARDEGANVAATAMAEAEQLQASAAAVPVAPPAYDKLRDAVSDISSKDSQSSILKALVQHAGEFAPRGAFFIIKNDHFVGWKVFGSDADSLESTVREIHFSTSEHSILGDAVRRLSTVEGSASSYPDDRRFLEPLGFGQPGKMYAVPLVARGRGVAVLYTDESDPSSQPNLEALEMLVRVAALTVELLASAHPRDDVQSAAADFEQTPHEEPAYVTDAAPSAFTQPFPEPAAAEAQYFSFGESVPYQEAGEPPMPSGSGYEPGFTSPAAPYEPDTATSDFSYQTAETSYQYEEQPADEQPSAEYTAQESSFDEAPSFGDPASFDSGGSIEHAAPEASPFEAPAMEFAPAGVPSGYEPAVEAAPPAAPVQARSRLSDRAVDLPIEVPDEERRSHNDARRFARLLVSEIKLYNEKKVLEGREANDLYDRLREAIDRSREMYDKRVQAPVASKFDYFHYELVNSLADGDAGRLGAGYPGAMA